MGDRWFVDTSAYFALFYDQDRHHREAAETWRFIENEGIQIITSNHVLDELATLLARRTSYAYSANRLTEIYESDIKIARSNLIIEKESISLFLKYADQKISFTDCVSFVLMDNLYLKKSFTFDRHFFFAGFHVEPGTI
jgi:uncharacterized protein